MNTQLDQFDISQIFGSVPTAAPVPATKGIDRLPEPKSSDFIGDLFRQRQLDVLLGEPTSRMTPNEMSKIFGTPEPSVYESTDTRPTFEKRANGWTVVRDAAGHITRAYSNEVTNPDAAFNVSLFPTGLAKTEDGEPEIGEDENGELLPGFEEICGRIYKRNAQGTAILQY
jgi:hypothetical protein